MPELSREIGRILGKATPAPTDEERERILTAVADADVYDDLPAEIRDLLDRLRTTPDPYRPRQDRPSADNSTTTTAQGRSAMTDLQNMISDYHSLKARMQGLSGVPAEEATDRDPGWRIERPQASADGTAPASAAPTKIYIYADIGGFFGVWPDEVIAQLRELQGPVEVHLHSPGGDAFDGVAIYNALRDYNAERGQVDVVIDGLAASAASVIAMAGSKVKMKRGSQLMIHDAWGGAIGPAEDMEKMRTFLDKISDSIAEIYAARAGGEPDEWRAAMKAESWYRDREAVEAGLADAVETDAQAAKNHWDLRVFAYAGRDAAPDPTYPGGRRNLRARPDTPAQAAAKMHAAAVAAKAKATGVSTGANDNAPGLIFTPHDDGSVTVQATQTPDAGTAAGSTPTEGAAAMTQPDPVKIREALGLGPDATDQQVSEAFASALGGQTPAPTPPAAPGTASTTSNEARLAQLAKDTGAVLIDPAQLDEMRRMAALGQEAYNTMRLKERDEIIDKAISEGKVALARREYWQNAWDKDPEGTRAALDELKPNLIPTSVAGYAGTSMAVTEAEAAYVGLFGKEG